MKEISNITVLLPVHKLDNPTKPLFINAVKSIETQQTLPDELLIVVSPEAKSVVESIDFGSIKGIVRIIENNGKTDFSSQINYGVENCKTEWFSILELDDEMSKIWLKNVVKYRNAYPDVEMFLPIIVDVEPNGGFLDLTNQPVWAAEFCDEMGILDKDTLLRYQNFNFDGMVMKTNVFKEFGGLKPSMKLTFIYEFLLRMTYNSARVMVIPKLGYKHVNQRPESLFNDYKNTLSLDESRWWMSQAKKEYFFINDRNITYTQDLNA